MKNQKFTRREKNKFYSGASWRKVRSLYLDKNPFCEVLLSVGIERTYQRIQVDHIIPIAYGGSMFDFRNLMTLSPKIHGKKTVMETKSGKPICKEVIQTKFGLIPKEKDKVITALLPKGFKLKFLREHLSD